MATRPPARRPREVDYPTGDGKPVAETPTHRDNLLGLIQVLRVHFADNPTIYVSGNMLLYYVRGDKRRHVSPDVFVVRNIVDRDRRRDCYLVWEEVRGPELVVEFTSQSTRKEDEVRKFELYRDTLQVLEYFLFDPFQEYLKPPMKGFRLAEGEYVPIAAVDGRLPSEVLGLHLERSGEDLRLHDPAAGRWVPTTLEMAQEREAELRRTEATLHQTETTLHQTEAARQAAERERDELRRQLVELRRELPGGQNGSSR